MRQTAPFINLNVDGRRTNPVGGKRRVQFDTTNSSGDLMSESFVSYSTSSDSGGGGFYGQGTGVKFELGQLMVTGDELNGWGTIKAATFAQSSSETVKTDIEDARAVLDPLGTIRAARARKFRYTNSSDTAPKIGVLAEELPAVLVQNRPDGTGARTPSIDLGSQIGVLWGAIGQLLDQESRTVTGRALVPNGAYVSGSTVTVTVLWDEPPLEVPSSVTAMALASMPTAMGKVRARLVPGSATMTGCQVRLEFLGTGAVAVTNSLPIAVEAVGRYIWIQPYSPPGARK
jgi:hypothetical protein